MEGGEYGCTRHVHQIPLVLQYWYPDVSGVQYSNFFLSIFFFSDPFGLNLLRLFLMKVFLQMLFPR
eukprot:c21797_g1_i2 orf=3-197(-)